MSIKRFLSIASIATTFVFFGCSQEMADETEIASNQSALTLNANQVGTNNGYFYSYWKDGGTFTMTMPDAPAQYPGNFGISWASGVYNGLAGKGWKPGTSTRVINYNAGSWNPGSSNAYLTLYGWTTSPLVEYYVVDSWGSWRPPGGTPAGTVTTDGGVYDLYKVQRVNAPSIQGTQTFWQYWSVRQTKRPTGVNSAITFNNHVKAWASKGWALGAHDEQIVTTEVFNPASSGSSNITVW
ncbi:MAG TPA: glycoside hydrolase family 11 protein [Polyangiaceae bacterium]|nr:glycoside hydrolase family 11 protein [Polyangiaceae bacterium]